MVIERDRHFEIIPARFLDLVEDMGVFDCNLGVGEVTQEDVSSINSLLKEPFNFYNSYI